MRRLASSLLLFGALGCTPATPPPQPAPQPAAELEPVPEAPWRRTEEHARELETPPVLIRGARLLVGDGTVIDDGPVLMEDGEIVAAGAGAGEAPDGARVIDAQGKVVTPGLIDTHSHLGVYPAPRAKAHMDGNEMTRPLTPDVRAVDAFWVQDPMIQRAVSGGVTTIQVLPGSGNLIGGRAVTLKMRRATASRDMRFEGAPDGLKMACGENPKRVYGSRETTPMTRMGNLALQRRAFHDARKLIAKWDKWRAEEAKRRREAATESRAYEAEKAERARKRAACEAGEHGAEQCAEWRRSWAQEPLEPPESIPTLPPKRDLGLETLAGALEGRVLVHIHCYRSDDMANMVALADEVDLAIRSFHHALEAYKIRDLLAERDISVSTWADWWGFKMEAYDGIRENLALVHDAGGRAIVHSDSAEGIQRLNQEAAKGMYVGRRAGLSISEAEAITWITSNAAWALGIDDHVGTLEAGKDADVVVWDRSPFSVYARAEQVFIDGVERHDGDEPERPWSDFEARP